MKKMFTLTSLLLLSVPAAFADVPQAPCMTLNATQTMSSSSKSNHISGISVSENCVNNQESGSLRLDAAVRVGKEMQQISIMIDTASYPSDSAALLYKMSQVATSGFSKEDNKEIKALLSSLQSAAAEAQDASNSDESANSLKQATDQFEAYLRNSSN